LSPAGIPPWFVAPPFGLRCAGVSSWFAPPFGLRSRMASSIRNGESRRYRDRWSRESRHSYAAELPCNTGTNGRPNQSTFNAGVRDCATVAQLDEHPPSPPFGTRAPTIGDGAGGALKLRSERRHQGKMLGARGLRRRCPRDVRGENQRGKPYGSTTEPEHAPSGPPAQLNRNIVPLPFDDDRSPHIGTITLGHGARERVRHRSVRTATSA
jgi:hypothetical protein